MFEKVGVGRTERISLLRPRLVMLSAAAHAAFAVGVALVPRRDMVVPPPVETATLLLIYQSPEAPRPLPKQAEARVPAHTRALRPGSPRTGAPVAEAKAPAEVSELELRAPPIVPEIIAASPPALDTALLRGIGDLGSVAGRGITVVPGAEGGDGAPVVDAGVLAEAPRLLNRREITSAMSRLYPRRLKARGIQGQVVVAFIIGIDGRAEMEGATVTAMSDSTFVEPSLAGLRRMRFRPAALDGRPVRVRASLPITWILMDL